MLQNISRNITCFTCIYNDDWLDRTWLVKSWLCMPLIMGLCCCYFSKFIFGLLLIAPPYSTFETFLLNFGVGCSSCQSDDCNGCRYWWKEIVPGKFWPMNVICSKLIPRMFGNYASDSLQNNIIFWGGLYFTDFLTILANRDFFKIVMLVV
jgi:hypothetical protein